RRRNRTLTPGLHLEQREGDPLAVLREGARCRRQTLALRKRSVERPQALLQQADLVGEGGPLGADGVVEHAARPSELVPEPGHTPFRRLAPQLETLGRAAEPVERLQRLLARTCRVGELLLRLPALGEEHLESLLHSAPPGAGRAPPPCVLREPLLEPSVVVLSG